MVTIIGYVKRKNNNGEEFNALILQGGIELVNSHETGHWYATAKQTSITCTFDEAMCQGLIGTELPGSVRRVESGPYKFIVRATGEELTLAHQWVYQKEGETIEEKVIPDSKVAMPI